VKYLIVISFLSLASCKKDYICICTDQDTGFKSPEWQYKNIAKKNLSDAKSRCKTDIEAGMNLSGENVTCDLQ